jgi:hypothetical protein
MSIQEQIDALPEWPDKENVDHRISLFPGNQVIKASAIAAFAQEQGDAALARLALARERLIRIGHDRDCAVICTTESSCDCESGMVLKALEVPQ